MLDCKAIRLFAARMMRAVRSLFRPRADGAAPVWPRIRRRIRFLRWALVVQLLKGAAFAGGGILLSRWFGS